LVLYGVACDEAQTILAADRQLAIQRADLDGLVQLLTAEGRRLESAPKSVPTSVFHAINPPDRRLTGAARDICRTGASVTTNCALIPRLHHESARCQQYRRQLQSCRVNHL
jgi:hypothetical protein